MKVICYQNVLIYSDGTINNQSGITIGKTYFVSGIVYRSNYEFNLENYNDSRVIIGYRIINDFGVEEIYLKPLLKRVEEHREEQLNKIIDF